MSDEKTPHDQRHGGPYDRGTFDSYYGRKPEPHYYVGAVASTQKITNLTREQVRAYWDGYEANQESGDRKDWG